MSILERFRLTDRVAIVTGGNRGLGRAMAESLAEAGAQVAVISRSQADAAEAASAIAQATGRICGGYGCDVSVPDQVATTVAQVAADFGQIHILVNNAGINIRGAITELSVDQFRQVQETNVTGSWLMCRAVVPHMQAVGSGRIINLGSTQSLVAMAERTPYSTSKGAVLMLTRALALELAPLNITVNAILPGPFATEMNRSLLTDPDTYQAFIAQVPLGRWGDLDEIGGLAVFLAGDTASFITGTGISIDGGWTAR